MHGGNTEKPEKYCQAQFKLLRQNYAAPLSYTKAQIKQAK